MANTCRFCHGWDKQHAIVRYGTRHYAHLRCLHARGRLREVLLKLTSWQLAQLPALELMDLGELEYVRGILKSEGIA